MVVQESPLWLTQLPRIACIHLTEQRCAPVRDHSLVFILEYRLVLAYDGNSGHTSTAGADRIIVFIAAHDRKVG